MNSPFQVDPWDAAKAHYERHMMAFMVRLMRHFGVTQVELPHDTLPADVVVDSQETPTGVFYRVKGHLRLDGDSQP